MNKGLETPLNSELIKILSDKIKSEKISLHKIAAPYATDAPHYAEKGINAVVFGPGDIGLAHKPAEYIDLNQMEKGMNIFYKLMTE